ncbi:MAG: DUF3667 domain-containing protein [Bacteroidales bacterium]|nr:DUF3667 domain-containing protein [Bacteroidales bacterium]
MSSYFRRLSSRLKRYFTKLGHSLTHPKEPKRYDFKGMKTIHKCSNCSLEYEGNFCPRCGQKASTSRLTPKNLLGGTLEVWDFNNKSVLGTIIELFHRPGYFIRDYLKGHRAAYYAPIKLLFLLCVIYAIEVQTGIIKTKKTKPDTQSTIEKPLTQEQKDSLDWAWAYEDDEEEDDQTVPQELKDSTAIASLNQADRQDNLSQTDSLSDELTEEEEEAYKRMRRQVENAKSISTGLITIGIKISDWTRNNKALSIIFLNITFALSCWILFRRAPDIDGKLSYTEHFFIQIYISCQLIVIAIIVLPFNSAANGQLSGWFLPLIMMWDFKQLFGISWIKSACKTLLVLILNCVTAFVLYGLITALTALVIAMVNN